MKPQSQSLQRRKNFRKPSKGRSIPNIAYAFFGAFGFYFSSRLSKYGYREFKASTPSQQPLGSSEPRTSSKYGIDSREPSWLPFTSSQPIREYDDHLLLRTFSSKNTSPLEPPPLPPPPPPQLPHPAEKQLIFLPERRRRGLAIVTVGSHQHTTFVNSEYGEIKAAFLYSISVANKARYCEYYSCSLIVGGPVPEAIGRSARWLKVAWLRRALGAVATAENSYYGSFEWVVWMDLDTIFAHPRVNLSSILDANYDLHLTPDFINSAVHNGRKKHNNVNTGFVAVRATTWSRAFIESVWQHNDRGRGLCDQAAINRLLLNMPRSEWSSHVKLYPKEVLNSFPKVADRFLRIHSQNTFSLPLDLELEARKLGLDKIVHITKAWKESLSVHSSRAGAYDGDEDFEKSMVYHFAGVFGGANSYTGQSSSVMLAQALDLFIERHQRFLEQLKAISSGSLLVSMSFERLRAARKVLASCRLALLEAENATLLLEHFTELKVAAGLQVVSRYVRATTESTSKTLLSVKRCETVISSPDLRSALMDIGSDLSSTHQNQPSWPSSILCSRKKSVIDPGSLPLAQPCGQTRPLWSKSINEIHFLPVQCAQQNLQNFRSYKLWIPHWSASERLMAHRLLEYFKSNTDIELPAVSIGHKMTSSLKSFENVRSGSKGAKITGLGKSARLTIATSGCAFTRISSTGTVAYDNSNRIQDWSVQPDINNFAASSDAATTMKFLGSFDSIALFPPVYKSTSGLHSLHDSSFWLERAPILLAYFAQLPSKNTVVELVGESLNDVERAVLLKLGISLSRWAAAAKSLDDDHTEKGTHDALRTYYANELFTFFITKRPDRPNFSAMHDTWLDVDALSTEWHELQAGIQTASTWLVAEALHEYHNSTPFKNQQRIIVVACSSGDTGAPLSCDEQVEALSDTFGRHSSGETFTVVQWHGGANILDHATAALMRNATILVAADADELLLGLLGPAQPFFSVPPENRQFFNNPHHSKPVQMQAKSLPPEAAPLAVVYWHFMGGTKELPSVVGPSSEFAQEASRFFSRRVRALAAIGLDIWPMPYWPIHEKEQPNISSTRAAFIRAVRAVTDATV